MPSAPVCSKQSVTAPVQHAFELIVIYEIHRTGGEFQIMTYKFYFKFCFILGHVRFNDVLHSF